MPRSCGVVVSTRGQSVPQRTVDKVWTVGCHTRGVLLTSSGQKPEMQLNILSCRTASQQSGGGGLVAESCPTLEIPWVVPHLGISVHGISQARIQEWVAISSSRGSSRPRTEPASPMSPALAGRFFTAETLALWPQMSIFPG